MGGPAVEVFAGPDALAHAAARHIVESAAAATAARGRFTLSLAGGSTPASLYRLLAMPPYHDQIAWDDVFVFFGDERCVPEDHPDSNYRMARETLLTHVPVPPGQVFPMPGEAIPEDGASAYADALRSVFALSPTGRPRFDLVLLGLGEDGHTASLFPVMQAVSEQRRLVTATQVPDYATPRVARITLTLPVLNNAAALVFMVSGSGKAGAVQKVLQRGTPVPPLPARLVHPRQGMLL